jgi:hypothetical protein
MYAELETARNRAKREFFDFLDKGWEGTPEQRAATHGNADRYKELRLAFADADAALLAEMRRMVADG